MRSGREKKILSQNAADLISVGAIKDYVQSFGFYLWEQSFKGTEVGNFRQEYFKVFWLGFTLSSPGFRRVLFLFGLRFLFVQGI